MKKKDLVFLSVLFTLIVSSSLFSQDKTESIIIGERITIKSEILDEERTIQVYLPEEYKSGSQRFPVLYVLDGSIYYYPSLGAAKFLSDMDISPPMIAVAIWSTDRTRDTTPTKIPRAQTSGGADSFLKFIRDELFTFIEKRYRTQPFRILLGHSAGGLLVFHSLLSQPEMFNGYIAVSSSLWWDDKVLLIKAKKFLEKTKEINKFLYFSVEEGESNHVKTNQEMEQLLKDRAPEGLEWQFDYVKNEDHESLWLRSFQKALKFIYKDYNISMDEVARKGLDAVHGHYRKLSEKYGYRIVATERVLLHIGAYVSGGLKEYGKAIEILNYCTKTYQDSHEAYYILGRIYDAQDKLELAQENFKRALEIAKAKSDPDMNKYKKDLEDIQNKLKAIKYPSA
jgi:predicted alpha/beta superfamily hydrolase